VERRSRRTAGVGTAPGGRARRSSPTRRCSTAWIPGRRASGTRSSSASTRRRRAGI